MQRSSCIVAAFLAFSGAAFLTLVPVRADPLPGQILKFQQLPLNNGGPVVAPYAGPYIAPNPFPVPGGLPPHPVTPFPGHNELSTAYAQFNLNQELVGWAGQYMADDFADRFESPVVHVRWWGSYFQDQRFDGVKRFLISFESDIPAVPPSTENPNGIPSRPGAPLLNQIVSLGPLAPGSGTYTEVLVPTPVGPGLPPPSEALYQYNAELHLGKEFPQQPDTVYWLKIVALVDPEAEGNIQWGWHNRDWSVPDLLGSVPPAVVPGEHIAGTLGGPEGPPVWHFQDNAVTGAVGVMFNPSMPIMPDVLQDGWVPQHYIAGLDGPPGIEEFSKDLAFELYTIPEPGSTLLVGLGLALAGLVRRRRDC